MNQVEGAILDAAYILTDHVYPLVDGKLLPQLDFYHSFLGMRTDLFPSFIRKPTVFFFLTIFYGYVVISNPSVFNISILALFYPLVYHFQSTDSRELNIANTLSQYWTVLAIICAFYQIFFYLFYIPGMHYLLLGLIYTLIRDDFFWINDFYLLIQSYYNDIDLKPILDSGLMYLALSYRSIRYPNRSVPSTTNNNVPEERELTEQ